MINLAINNYLKPVIKRPQALTLKPLYKLESVKIFAMPTRIKDRDISAMFNGLLALLKEKVQQEQTEKYLQLKLKYTRLQKLYNRAKIQLCKQKILCKN